MYRALPAANSSLGRSCLLYVFEVLENLLPPMRVVGAIVCVCVLLPLLHKNSNERFIDLPIPRHTTPSTIGPPRLTTRPPYPFCQDDHLMSIRCRTPLLPLLPLTRDPDEQLYQSIRRQLGRYLLPPLSPSLREPNSDELPDDLTQSIIRQLRRYAVTINRQRFRLYLPGRMDQRRDEAFRRRISLRRRIAKDFDIDPPHPLGPPRRPQ